MRRRRWSLALVLGAIAAIAWAERRRPLRPHLERRATHVARNLAIASGAALTVALAERPVAHGLARHVRDRRWGVVQRLPLPGVVRDALAWLLLDYSLYVWHRALHRVPWLWRFHQAHHADLDVDTSTAMRLHFGELLLSIGWRAAQIAAIGVTPRVLAIWQAGVLLSIHFHHANLRLPPRLERILGGLVMTPRLHGIHHLALREAMSANLSSGLLVWDQLHRTHLGEPPAGGAAGAGLGLPAHRDLRDVTLARVLMMPFAKQPRT